MEQNRRIRKATTMLGPKNTTLEQWLREKVAPAYDAIKAEPNRAVTLEQVRARLKRTHEEAIARKAKAS